MRSANLKTKEMKPEIENLRARISGVPLSKYQIALSKTEFVKLLDYVAELETLCKHEVGSSVCDHDWVRLGDPDRQACRCKKCGKYDG